jgi:polysaccharide deacetylase 2 family uncharacterized protein YibQ
MFFFFCFIFSLATYGAETPSTGFNRFTLDLPTSKEGNPTITVIVANLGTTRKGDELLRILDKNVTLSFFDYEKIPQSLLTMAMNNGHHLLLTLSVPAPLEGVSNPSAFRESVDSERLADWQKLGPAFKGLLLSHGHYGDDKNLKIILDYAAKTNQAVIFPEPQQDVKKICEEAKARCIVGHMLITQKDTQEQLQKKLEKAETLSKSLGHIIVTIHTNDLLLDYVRTWVGGLKEKKITLSPQELFGK